MEPQELFGTLGLSSTPTLLLDQSFLALSFRLRNANSPFCVEHCIVHSAGSMLDRGQAQRQMIADTIIILSGMAGVMAIMNR